GFWGLYAMNETSLAVAGNTHVPAYGWGLDLRVPLADWVTFQCEAYSGRNLDEFRGGIGQGIDPRPGKGIRTSGGWAELVFRWVNWHQLATGFSIDNPANADIPIGGRTRNYAWYVSNQFPVGSGVTFGADYENWTTDYQGFDLGDASL